MKQIASTRGQRFILVIVFLFLLSEVLGGAIRYGFARTGLAPLVYLPKALLGLALVVALAVDLARVRMSATYLAALALLALGLVHGYLVLGKPVQVAFGLWVLIPFLGGIVALPALVSAWPRVGLYAFVLWAVAVSGVLINVVYSWPWMGFEYTLAGLEIEGSRLWQTGGLVRLAGFSRASFEAANQILPLAAVLMVWGRGEWRLAVWLLSGVTVALTTTKTPIAIYLVLTLFWLTRRSAMRNVWRLLPIGLAAISSTFPLSTLLVDYDLSSILEDPVHRLLFASVGDRLEWMWPDTLAMVLKHGTVLFGRGVGGIGMAQQYFEPVLYSPADNLAVYLYALFGILGIGSLVLYALGLSLFALRDRISLLVFVAGLIVLLAGLTGNVLESSVLGFVFGASLGYAVGAVLAGCVVGRTARARQPWPLRLDPDAGTCESGQEQSAVPDVGRGHRSGESPGHA